MVFYLFLFAVVFSFLANGGLTGITDVPSALDALSRIASLLGTALLLMMLLLTARVPWIDAQFGQDVATDTHKRLGKPAFYLILAHFIFSLTSYAMTDGRDLLSELWFLMTTFEDLTKAVISMVAMILVVVTSFKAVRRLLKYETWYLTHLLAYISVLFAIPHTFEMGTDLVSELSNAMWVFAFVFVGFNILWFRVILPLTRSMASQVTVSKVTLESSDTVSLYLSGKKLSRFSAQPGQFMMVRFMTKKLWGQSHPFSLSAVPTDDQLRLTIGSRGDGSSVMQGIKPGTKVILSGPFGVFTEAMRTNRKVVLIAAGIGIPPVRALAEGMAANPGDIGILYRTRTSDDAPLADELQELSELRGHHLEIASGARPTNGNWLSHGSQTDAQRLTELFPEIHTADVYVCGPVSFTAAVKATLKELKLPDSAIHSEEYAW
ncbi:MAG: hypothetical protein RL418_245 [Actinomycetota bacterium]